MKTNEVWSVPGYIVINMELADATLLDLMLLYHNDLDQPIDPPQLCRYMWQVAEALDFLNARKHLRDGRKVGFQHGDVKPNNILLVGETAKLTDHGLATPTHGNDHSVPAAGHSRVRRAGDLRRALFRSVRPVQPRGHILRRCGPGLSRSLRRRRSCPRISRVLLPTWAT